jgi:hypothetical protein
MAWDDGGWENDAEEDWTIDGFNDMAAEEKVVSPPKATASQSKWTPPVT